MDQRLPILTENDYHLGYDGGGPTAVHLGYGGALGELEPGLVHADGITGSDTATLIGTGVSPATG